MTHAEYSLRHSTFLEGGRIAKPNYKPFLVSVADSLELLQTGMKKDREDADQKHPLTGQRTAYEMQKDLRSKILISTDEHIATIEARTISILPR